MTLNTDVYTAQNPDGLSAHDLLEAALVQGRRRCTIATHVADGTEGSTPTLQIAKLPLGAYVLSARVKILSPYPAATATLGDSDDPDRYLTAIDLDAAANTVTGTENGVGVGHKIANAAQRDIEMVFSGGTPVAGDSLVVILEWAQT